MDFPLLGQQVAIDLANSVWVGAGRRHDALETVAGADRWLRAVAEHRLGDGSSLIEAAGGPRAVRVGDEDFRDHLVRLRTLVRDLLGAMADGRSPSAATVKALNALCAAAPSRLEATRHGSTLELRRRRPPPAPAALLAALAEDALLMLSGAGGPILACPSPGCLGLVVQTDPRRRFCSPGCAGRARVARHYARQRSAEDQET